MADRSNTGLLFGLAAAAAAVAFLATPAKAAAESVLTTVALTADQARKILQLHPAARQRFYNFIRDIERRTDYKVLIPFDPYRTFQQQQVLYDQNHSNAKPGYSMHNFGMAVDINLQKGNEIVRKASPLADWRKTGVVDIAKEHGMFWGGDLATYHDPVHFDLRKSYDINELRRRAIEQFGSIQSAEGNKVSL